MINKSNLQNHGDFSGYVVASYLLQIPRSVTLWQITSSEDNTLYIQSMCAHLYLDWLWTSSADYTVAPACSTPSPHLQLYNMYSDQQLILSLCVYAVSQQPWLQLSGRCLPFPQIPYEG